MKKLTGLFAACVLLFSGAAHSTLITYTAENTGGNTYEFNFTIENTGSIPLDAFAVFFDLGLFENLVVSNAPTDWDVFAVDPDTGIPDDGFFDALALVFPLAPGDILTGFTITADFIGDGLPGDLFYEFYDSLTFETIFRGSAENLTVSVPEPGTLPLLLLSLFILALARRRSVSDDNRVVAYTTNAITARAA